VLIGCSRCATHPCAHRNVLGSLGFLLSGLGGIVYGPDNEVGRQWLSNFTTYIGSWFFLFGSALQYYEAAK
jgi:hypothetical protein